MMKRKTTRHSNNLDTKQLTAMRDVGALVRSTRRYRGLTQAELAALVGVGREWVVRLEQGSPRVEAQKVLDVMNTLGLVLQATPADPSSNQPSDQSSDPSSESSDQLSALGTTPVRAAGTRRTSDTTVKVSDETKAPTRVTKSPPKGRWVVKPAKSSGGATKSSRPPGGAAKSVRAVKLAKPSTSPKPAGSAGASSAEDPFDALFSQKRR